LASFAVVSLQYREKRLEIQYGFTGRLRKINVFRFNDLLEILREFLNANKLAAMLFTKYCGIKSRNHLYEVLHLRRRLRNNNICRIMDGMELKGFERIYFDALISLHNAKSDELKKHYQDNVRFLQKKIYKFK